MKLLIKNVNNIQIPAHANPGEDAAYDIVATTPPNIIGTRIQRPLDGMDLWQRIVYIEYGTDLYVAPEPEVYYPEVADGESFKGLVDEVRYHLELYPRSSISKNNLILANCVPIIDGGYRGQIMLRFKYIFQPEDMVVLAEAGVNRVYGILNKDAIYDKGEKIVQLKAARNIPINFVLTSDLPPSKRGYGGFGSSDKGLTS